MMEDITAENIEQAIWQFYHTSDGREKAHKWLSSIQNSPSAWQFCWQLISKEKSQEVQFFGATTLQLKILKNWYQVPEEQGSQLQSQVMDRLLAFSSSPADRLIANKLCLSMSALILHTIDEQWPAAVTEVISTFQAYDGIPQEARCRLLLDILMGLADQYPMAVFGVQSSKKAAVHAKLMTGFDQIHSLLCSLLEENVPTAVKDSALRCMTSWIEFGIKIDRLGTLVSRAFTCLHDDSLFETAVDTLIAALTKNEPGRYPNTLQSYFSEILNLLPRWVNAVNEEDKDWCRDISRLIVNFAEENVDVLIAYASGTADQQELCMRIVQMILTLTDVKGNFPVDETLSDLPFGFWYILQDVILSSTEAQFNQLMTAFTPVYINLVHILMKKVQYPEDSVYASMNSEEKEQLRCYRQDVSDTVMYANCLLRENLLTMMKGYISTVSQVLPNVAWQHVECILYILSHIPEDSLTAAEEEWDVEHDVAIQKDSSVFGDLLERLVNMVSKVSLDNSYLLTSALQAIGAFSDHYSSKPHLLQTVFPIILLQGLNSSDAALFATRALKDICHDNPSVLPAYSDSILTVCHAKLADGSLSPRNAARLMSAVGYVLTALPGDKIVQWLNKLIPPIIEALTMAASASPSAAVKAAMLDKLQMMTWLCDSLDPKDCKPVLVILKDMLPVLHSILTKWVTDPNVVECIVELLDKSLRSLVDDFKPIIGEVCELLVKIFECLAHPSVLDMLKRLVLIFNTDVATFDTVKRTFHCVSQRTLLTVRTDGQNKTDLLESYMNLCCQMSKKSPKIIADEEFPFEGTVEIAIIGISFPEAPTMKASCQFLADVLSKRSVYSKLDGVMEKLASPLYDIMLKSIGGASPRANVDNTIGVFLAMNTSYFDLASGIMTVLLSQDGYPVPHPTLEQKLRFVKDVLRERNNKRRLKDTVAHFSMVCRGIAGTEYARQTAVSMQYR